MIERRGAQDKSRFVKEIEEALLRGRRRPRGPQRQGRARRAAGGARDRRRAGRRGPARRARRQRRLARRAAEGARVGTSSLRRRSQLLAIRPDLEVVELRGQRRHPPAKARRRRLRRDRAGARGPCAGWAATQRPAPSLEVDDFVPAAGQGILALEARADDAAIAEVAQQLSDETALLQAAGRARRRRARSERAATRRSARTPASRRQGSGSTPTSDCPTAANGSATASKARGDACCARDASSRSACWPPARASSCGGRSGRASFSLTHALHERGNRLSRRRRPGRSRPRHQRARST